MTLSLPLLYFFWTEEYCQNSPNKNKSPNLWQVTSLKQPLKLKIFQNSLRNKKCLKNGPEMGCNINSKKLVKKAKNGVSQEHIGSLILAKIYIFTRCKLLFTLWDEIPCILKFIVNNSSKCRGVMIQKSTLKRFVSHWKCVHPTWIFARKNAGDLLSLRTDQKKPCPVCSSMLNTRHFLFSFVYFLFLLYAKLQSW